MAPNREPQKPTTDPAWLTIALREEALGIEETPGPAANPRIIEYHRHTTLEAGSDEVSWCAAFVGFCLDEAHVGGTGSAAARSYCNWGQPCEPQRGAVVVFRRGTQPWQGHVGFILDVLPDGRLLVLGGNQGDKVCREIFRTSAVLAYRWPLAA